MRKSLFILPVLALTMLTACETVKGVGRDVEKKLGPSSPMDPVRFKTICDNAEAFGFA